MIFVTSTFSCKYWTKFSCSEPGVLPVTSIFKHIKFRSAHENIFEGVGFNLPDHMLKIQDGREDHFAESCFGN